MKVDAISKELSKEHKAYIEKIIGKPVDVNAKQWINFSSNLLLCIKHKRNA